MSTQQNFVINEDLQNAINQAIAQGVQQAVAQASQKVDQLVSQAVQQAQQDVKRTASSDSSSNKNIDYSSNRNVEHNNDVSEAEAMRSFAPQWALNSKILLDDQIKAARNSQERYDSLAAQLQQESLNLIRQLNAQTIEAMGNRSSINFKTLSNTITQPTFFPEDAPAEDPVDKVANVGQ